MTRSPSPRRSARGFTLIEIMVVVGIVGMLSSIAIPNYQRMLLRAKAAERIAIMNAIANGMSDILQTQQGVPGGTLAGAWNPPGPLSTARRPFDRALPGWLQLPVIVEGGTFYSYQFTAVDGGPNGTTTLDVFGNGDLDGDGVTDAKLMHYDAIGYSLQLTSQVPPAGAESSTTF